MMLKQQMNILAWHFVGPTLRDSRPVPQDRQWLVHNAPLILCSSGYHASVKLLDALSYAPGTTICRVACSGKRDMGHDKLVCEKRMILWRVDGAALLSEFAIWCARKTLHLWDAPPIVEQFLKTGDDSLREAVRSSITVSISKDNPAMLAAKAAAKKDRAIAACLAGIYTARALAQDRANDHVNAQRGNLAFEDCFVQTRMDQEFKLLTLVLEEHQSTASPPEEIA